MVTQNAQLVANSIMAEAIEYWLASYDFWYAHEELVERGQVLPIAEEI